MWIELHDNLPDHPKVVKLSKLLNMDRDLARAKLERLWLWALNNRLNGVLSDDDVLLLEDIMRLKGKQSETMVDALVQCKLLDPVEGGYSIHDWDDHAGMLIDKKTIQREQSRLRKQKQRDMAKKINGTSVTCHADVTRDMSVTDVTIPAEVTRENRDCHAPTVTYTKTNTIKDIMTDTISVSHAQAQGELSTACGKLSVEQVRGAWMHVLATVPSENEVKTVLRHSVGMDISAVKYALELTCLYGANNVAAYAARTLNEWNTLGITTEDAARAWREAQEA